MEDLIGSLIAGAGGASSFPLDETLRVLISLTIGAPELFVVEALLRVEILSAFIYSYIDSNMYFRVSNESRED